MTFEPWIILTPLSFMIIWGFWKIERLKDGSGLKEWYKAFGMEE